MEEAPKERKTANSSDNLMSSAKGFRAKKRYGQNFLVSPEILQQIEDTIEPQIGEEIMEIGPGLGFLTDKLLSRRARVLAIDIDPRALNRIAPHHHLTKIHADALHYNYAQHQHDIRIVGNLPFNVGTQILLKIIGELNEPLWRVSNASELVFMFQKELAERLVASPGSKTYNSLSITVQLKAQAEYMFTIPASAFKPKPMVQAALVRLRPIEPRRNLLLDTDELERKLLRTLLKAAFSSKRKMIKNNLKNVLTIDDFSTLDISPELRPECLSLEAYLQMAKLKRKQL